MGSFYVADGITQLPITGGDKVRAFILFRKGEMEGGGTCYPYDLWAPFANGIQAQYYDYGEIYKVVEDDLTSLINDEIGHLVKIQEPSCHKDSSMSNIFAAIRSDEVEIDYCYRKHKLGLMFILEDIYQSVISYNPIVGHHKDKGYLYMPLKQSIEIRLKKWYELITNEFNKKDDRFLLNIMSGFSTFTNAEAFVFHHSNDGLYPLKDKLIEYIQAGLPFEDVKVQFISNCIIDATILNYAMSSSRKMWIPQSSSGSQESDSSIYKLINNASNKIIKKRESDKKNDCDPEYWKKSRPDKNGYSKWMLEHNAEELKK